MQLQSFENPEAGVVSGGFFPPSVSFNCGIDTNPQKFDSTVEVSRRKVYMLPCVSEQTKLQQKIYLIPCYLWEKCSEVQWDILLGQK